MSATENLNSSLMFQTHPKSDVVMAQPGVLAEIEARERAHRNQDLKQLLILERHLSFRLYVVFPKSHPGKHRNPGRHFYGNEHRVTYKQCLYGRVPHIALDKVQGYTALIRLVEEQMKGQWLTAQIYSRSDESSIDFDVLHREYYKGGLDKCDDPVLTEQHNKKLWFSTKENRLQLLDTDPALIDFKSEMAMVWRC